MLMIASTQNWSPSVLHVFFFAAPFRKMPRDWFDSFISEALDFNFIWGLQIHFEWMLGTYCMR